MVTFDGGVVIERSQIRGGEVLVLEVVFEAHPVVNASATITLPDPLEASAKCEITEDIPIPITGPLKDIVAPLLEIGFGIQLEGQVSGAQLGLGGVLVLDAGMIRTGLRYQSGSGLVAIQPDLSAATLDGTGVEVLTPDLSGVRIDASVFLYEITHLKVGSKWLIDAGIDRFTQEFTTTRLGARHSIEALADEVGQLDDAAFATNYTTELVYQLAPGEYYDGFLWLVGLETEDVTFEVSPQVAASPVGVLSLSPGTGVPDEPVTATVTLTSGERYLGADVVESVHLFHQVAGSWVEMGPPEPGVTEATFTWTPTAADTGSHRFAAMVKTALFPGLMEIAPDSVQTIAVGGDVGTATLIFDSAGTPLEFPEDINDAGMVTGYTGGWWLYRPGTGVERVVDGIGYLSDTGVGVYPTDWMLPGDTGGTVSATSRNGVFAGSSSRPGMERAFVYSGSSMEILSSYTPGVDMWAIHAVDDSGVVVGSAAIPSGGNAVPAFLSGASPAPIGLPGALDTGEVYMRTNGGLMSGVGMELGVAGSLRTVVWTSTGTPTVLDPAVIGDVVDIEDPDLILATCPGGGACYRMGRLGGTFVPLPTSVDVVTDPASGTVSPVDIQLYVGMNASGTLLASGSWGPFGQLAVIVPAPALP